MPQLATISCNHFLQPLLAVDPLQLILTTTNTSFLSFNPSLSSLSSRQWPLLVTSIEQRKRREKLPKTS
jgi:hypothetical protein